MNYNVEKEEILEEVSEEEQKKLREKKEKKEKEKDRLLSSLVSNDMKNFITRVAFILNHYPNTRNSDVTLQLQYWSIFQSDIYNGGDVKPEDLYKLERLTSITRARAKIQNEHKLFVAEEKIVRYRRTKEEEIKEIQIENKPTIPTLNIYCDESGKTGKFLIVGGLWILDFQSQEKLRSHFFRWRQEKEISTKHEFHFTEMRRHQLDLYKEFFNEAIKNSDMMGYKAVAVEASTIRGKPLDEIISDLHYQLVHLGVEHENDSGRVLLPRQVNIWKDKEDGSDALYMIKLQQHLVSNFRYYFDDKLKLALFSSVESYTSPFIQLADLFTGSVSRVLNKTGNERNHKDELAEYILDLLGMDDLSSQNRKDIAMLKILEI